MLHPLKNKASYPAYRYVSVLMDYKQYNILLSHDVNIVLAIILKSSTLLYQIK